jgi:hypothetical protein
MLRFIVLVTLCVLFGVDQASGATILSDNFPGSTLNPQWSMHHTGTKFVVSNGVGIAKTAATQGRTEIQANTSADNLFADRTYCIRVGVKPAQSGPRPSWGPSVIQFHATPGAGLDWSCATGRNPLTIGWDTAGKQFQVRALDSRVGKPTGSAFAPVTANVPGGNLGLWTDFAMTLRMSGTNGLVVVKANGKQVVNVARPNWDSKDSCGRPAGKSTYLKLGLYFGPSAAGTHEVHYRNVSITEGACQ